MRGMLGRKVGMTQYFTDDGRQVPVTILELPPNRVLQVKTQDRDGYDALQLGAFAKKEKRATRAELGHARGAGGPCRFVREVRLAEPGEYQAGQTVGVSELFEGVGKVIVTGVTKGRGFAGVMKRHGFSGYPATHGVKTHHRHPGSIGQCQDPGRVFKGKRMAGHMGAARRSQKGVRVEKILPDRHLMLVRGSVPGPNGGYVMVREDVGYVAPARA